jgi:hypothetical protein
MTTSRPFILTALTVLALSGVQAQTIPNKAASAPECRVKDPEISGRYVGQCNPMGWAHGTGSAQGATASYTGEFKDGQKNGVGVKLWTQTADRYVGQFKNDFRDGVGLYVWGEKSGLFGYQYNGQFKLDKREGQGIFNWPNGESYAGRWAADAQLDGFTPTQILQGKEFNAKIGAWNKP